MLLFVFVLVSLCLSNYPIAEYCRTIDEVVDWLMSEPKEEAVKEEPLAMLRRVFTEDLKAGVALSTEQHNLIYLTSHTPGLKYEWFSLYVLLLFFCCCVVYLLQGEKEFAF